MRWPRNGRRRLLRRERVQGCKVIGLKEENGSEKVISFAEATKVSVYPMTETEIKNYVASGEPMDKAGAYGIQGRFAEYVSHIEGDYNNVVGLPLSALLQEAKKMEV